MNLADVKCIREGHFNDHRNVMVVEFKSRRQNVKNPVSDEFELQEFNDFTEVEFESYDILIQHRRELWEVWEEYLKNVE